MLLPCKGSRPEAFRVDARRVRNLLRVRGRWFLPCRYAKSGPSRGGGLIAMWFSNAA